MQIPRRLTEVKLREGAPAVGWLAVHIEFARWIEASPAAAIGGQESSREEIAADIQRGAMYFVISDDKRSVKLTVSSVAPGTNFLHAFPEGGVRDRICDLPTYS